MEEDEVNNFKIKSLKKIPVCGFIIVSLLIIFALYFINVIKSAPCDKDMASVFVSNFVHTDIFHMLSNAFSLYSLSVIEERLGSETFVKIIIFFLAVNTILETMLHKIIDVPCSIGFSGVLFSMMSFELVAKNIIDTNIILSLCFNMGLAISKGKESKVSIYGHVIGIISGVIAGITFKKIK